MARLKKLPLYFEDLHVDQTFGDEDHEGGHNPPLVEYRRPLFWKVLLDDIKRFVDLSGDKNPLHVDGEFARQVGFDGVVAHGILNLSIGVGAISGAGIWDGAVKALVGFSCDPILAPAYPGDIFRIVFRVKNKKEPSRGKNAGLAEFHYAIYKHPKNECACLGYFKIFILKRPG